MMDRRLHSSCSYPVDWWRCGPAILGWRARRTRDVCILVRLSPFRTCPNVWVFRMEFFKSTLISFVETERFTGSFRKLI